MPFDFFDFLSKPHNPKKYIIDQLISTDSGFGLVAGRTGLGKTNLLLNLSCMLSTGSDFFGLATKKCRVGYFTFEGGEDNLKDRYFRILKRGYVPDPDYLQVDRIDSLVILDKSNRFKFTSMIRTSFCKRKIIAY